MSGEVWEQVYDRLAELIEAHRTTLIFVNTRRMAERAARQLSERLGDHQLAAHHGSLAKEQRLDAEQRLKGGTLKALVATASLELGIDIGEVDLVCQLGSPRSIASFLQRVGRSGHAVEGTPRAGCSRSRATSCRVRGAARQRRPWRARSADDPGTAARRARAADRRRSRRTRMERGRLLCARAPRLALSCARARGFRSGGGHAGGRLPAPGGRRGALIHHDAVNHVLRGRRGARLTALTNGGTIPDTADYQVLLEPENPRHRHRERGLRRREPRRRRLPARQQRLSHHARRARHRPRRGCARHGAHHSVLAGRGARPHRRAVASVSRLRAEIAARCRPTRTGEGAMRWLAGEVGIAEPAARQLAEYLAAGHAALGCLPTQDTLVLERFFDEVGGMQLVIHSPYGSRINRAWGLALRKRFCRRFNFELQAAATEDNIVLSLTTAHSFELGEVARYLHSASVRHLLIQALLDAPMFITRWRWVAGVALALPRFRGGRKVPPQLVRMDAEDLITAIFPDQLACAENLSASARSPTTR